MNTRQQMIREEKLHYGVKIVSTCQTQLTFGIMEVKKSKIFSTIPKEAKDHGQDYFRCPSSTVA